MEKKNYLLRAGELNGNVVGQALLTGHLVATIRSVKSGREQAIQFTCKREGPPKRQGDKRSWEPVSFPEADKVFIDVPRRNGEGELRSGSQVATWDLTGKYAGSMISPYGAEAFDEKRIWAALKLLDVAGGRAPMEREEVYRVETGVTCFMCADELMSEAEKGRGRCENCETRFQGWEAPAVSRQEVGTGTIAAAVGAALDPDDELWREADPGPERAPEDEETPSIATGSSRSRWLPPEDQLTILEPGEAASSAVTTDYESPWWEKDEAKRNRGIQTQKPRPHRDDYLKRLDEGEGDAGTE